MSEERDAIDTHRDQELAAEIDRLQTELRRRLLVLVEHPAISDDFKDNALVKEWIK